MHRKTPRYSFVTRLVVAVALAVGASLVVTQFVVGDPAATSTASATVDPSARAEAGDDASRSAQRSDVVPQELSAALSQQQAAAAAEAEAKRLAAEEAARQKAEEEAARKAAEEEAARKAAEEEAARQKAEEEAQAAIANAVADPKSAARVMLSDYGWGDDQFQCLDSLWTRESNWSHTAQNPASGAYGIPQSLPGSKMASVGDDWRTNPITQIRWGLGYIDERYGTPCSAWGHSQSTGWY